MKSVGDVGESSENLLARLCEVAAARRFLIGVEAAGVVGESCNVPRAS